MKYPTFLAFLFMLFSIITPFAYSIEINENDVNIFNNSESDTIDFRGPQGYKDQEFEELQRAYINPKYINLDDLKKIPTDQLSNEFVQKLINLITKKVNDNVKVEMVKYLKGILNQRKASQSPVNRSLSGRKQIVPEFYKDIFEPEDLVSSNVMDSKKKKLTNKDRIDNLVSMGTKTEPSFNRGAGRISNVNFVRSGNAHFISINGLSRETISTSVFYNKGVSLVDVSFYIKNISNSMIYLLKRTTASVKGSGSRSFQFNWVKPQIPIGKYKILIAVKFNRGNKVLNREERYWGNPSSNDYIVYKN